jgi:uncharacterized protein
MTTRLSRRAMDQPLLVLSHHNIFTGYASLFNKRDAAGDIVMRGAFTDSIKNRGASGIRMLFQHDPAEPVGVWLDIAEDERGLAVRGRLDANVQRGRELMSLLQSKGVDGLSIGFKTLHATRDRALNARRIAKVDLWEISLVTFPMLEGARVSQVTTRARALAERVFLKSPPSSQQELSNPWN